MVAGIIGDDAPGLRVRTALAEAGVEDALSVADDGRPTTVKTRIIAHHQQVVRADREASTPVAGALERALLQPLQAVLPSCGALSLSDYHKGCHPRSMKAVWPWPPRAACPCWWTRRSRTSASIAAWPW